MPRHWDIKLVAIAVLGAAAYGLVYILQNNSLTNVPDENVVYIDSTVGGVEPDDAPGDATDENGAEEQATNRDANTLESNVE